VETLEGYLTNLASSAPVPGGGSAAAVVAASGAALVGMVARICAQNPKYAAHAELTRRIVAATDALRTQFDAARELDERAFASVIAAQERPRKTVVEIAVRQAALDAALQAAAAEPLKTSALALEVVRLADEILRVPNKGLASDAGCAAEFGFAALAACAYNVRVNHRYMRDEAVILCQTTELERYENEASELLLHVRRTVAEALARPASAG
jgi:formiminotetrahydrofolate cyclodeaminase